MKGWALLPKPELTCVGWLTLAELEANFAHRGLEPGDFLHRPAALATMADLAAAYGRNSVHLVFFW